MPEKINERAESPITEETKRRLSSAEIADVAREIGEPAAESLGLYLIANIQKKAAIGFCLTGLIPTRGNLMTAKRFITQSPRCLTARIPLTAHTNFRLRVRGSRGI